MSLTKTLVKKQKNKKTKVLKGFEILVQSLIEQEVEYIFGYPGGALLDVYDELYRTSQLHHILVRHEQGATHAADGYARVTGKPGVVLVTSGPGATNTVTGIATAYMDSIPLVVLTGQVPSKLIGYDAFQEADIVGITRPITKHSYLVQDANDLSRIVHEAFYIAVSGRPGPVLIDLPKDVLSSEGIVTRKEEVDIEGYKPVNKGHSQQIQKAAALINQAERPLIYAGGGVNLAGASRELQELSRKGNIPVTATIHGLGSFPADNELFLGMVGMHGTWTANTAISECDVLIAVGARFDDRVTGRVNSFSTKSKKIHIDIDPSCISKIIKVNVPIVGNAKDILPEISRQIDAGEREQWIHAIRKWKKEHPLHYQTTDNFVSPQFVIEKINALTGGDCIVAVDVGQNQMWTAQYFGFNRPRTFLNSGGLGTMGYSLPAAIGAAMGGKGKKVFAICGDGGFQMNMQELATAVNYKLPLKIIILNNEYLGMVRQWQELFRGGRYSHTWIKQGSPKFTELAESFGIEAYRVAEQDKVEAYLKKSMEVDDKPFLLEFMVSPKENVFPMVPAGAALSEMLTGGEQ